MAEQCTQDEQESRRAYRLLKGFRQMDENGIFNGDVFGKLPVVYLMCDERNLANELRVPDDGAILGIDDDENVTENASPER